MGRILSVIFLLCYLSFNLNAQLNLKIGYESAFISSKQNKIVVDQFNSIYAEELSQGKELQNLGFANGLTLGVLYKWENARISANWHSAFRKREAFGEINDPPESFEREVRYRMSGLSLQYEFVYDRYSIGFGPGRDVFQMTSVIGGSSNDKTLMNEVVYNVRFNLGIRLFSTERVSVLIEPYYTFLLNDLDHTGEFEFFDSPTIPDDVFDRPHYFGVQLLFYNGLQ